jgi:DNA-binding Lrp family transcriptional regulator
MRDTSCSLGLAPLDLAILDRWQRDFPLVTRPFALLGAALGLSEDEVVGRVGVLMARDLITRIGAVVRPNTVGASTLAAMAVPPARLQRVAELVSAEPSVTHNYEREHALNLWFVVTAADRAAVDDVLARIEAESGLDVIDLPLVTAYHIDLGFPLTKGGTVARGRNATRSPADLTAHDRVILAAIEDGLPLTREPYRAVASQLDISERQVIEALGRLCRIGVISRFGVIVKHRSLGYRANAMAVWDVPDRDVDDVAASFTRHDFVTLCYRRPRRLPVWPYNLFCMVHGASREKVGEQLAALDNAAGTGALPQAVLFSRRCFKQRGARFAPVIEEMAVSA